MNGDRWWTLTWTHRGAGQIRAPQQRAARSERRWALINEAVIIIPSFHTQFYEVWCPVIAIKSRFKSRSLLSGDVRWKYWIGNNSYGSFTVGRTVKKDMQPVSVLMLHQRGLKCTLHLGLPGRGSEHRGGYEAQTLYQGYRVLGLQLKIYIYFDNQSIKLWSWSDASKGVLIAYSENIVDRS